MNKNKIKLKDLPNKLRPREKLFERGAAALSDIELMSIILGSSIKGKDLFSLAEEVLFNLDNINYKIDESSMGKINGLGQAKTATLAAAIEYSRRVLCPQSKRIKAPSDIYPYIRHYADRKQEVFLCASLNGAHEIITIRVVSIGLLNRSLVHPREVFADPLADRAAAIIVCHNHPSGNIEPSSEDIEITIRLKEASEILGVKMLDHIIFSESGCKSITTDNAD